MPGLESFHSADGGSTCSPLVLSYPACMEAMRQPSGPAAALRLEPAWLPEPLWNSHLACLAGLSAACARGLDLVDCAGLTGIAFRTALCRQVTPAGLHHSWAWAPQFSRWLDCLGLDADIAAHYPSHRAFHAWLARQQLGITACLERGLPAMFWDNCAFSTILGEDAENYYTSGIPQRLLHPLWFEQTQAAAVCARAFESAARDPFAVPRREIAPVLDDNALFITLAGVSNFNPEQAAMESVYWAYRELAGLIEFPRRLDDLEIAYEPQYGTQALLRWRDELQDKLIHAFGQITAVQALFEARRLAVLYLKRLPDRLPAEAKGRIEQAGGILARVLDYLRPLTGMFDLPLDPENQLRQGRRDACREALYQVEQTERTVARLLASVAREYLDA